MDPIATASITDSTIFAEKMMVFDMTATEGECGAGRPMNSRTTTAHEFAAGVERRPLLNSV
jgi:hypothetical protein